LTIYTDSELMARQLLGQYQVRAEHLQAMHQEAMIRLSRFPDVRICHISRKDNKNADRLASKAAQAEKDASSKQA